MGVPFQIFKKDYIFRFLRSSFRSFSFHNYYGIQAASKNGWIDERTTTMESLLAMRRAGADIILTYAAIKAANWLKEGS